MIFAPLEWLPPYVQVAPTLSIALGSAALPAQVLIYNLAPSKVAGFPNILAVKVTLMVFRLWSTFTIGVMIGTPNVSVPSLNACP